MSKRYAAARFPRRNTHGDSIDVASGDMSLPIHESVDELRAFVAAQRRAGRSIGFVPTMGNLHAGHYSLVERARECADCVVASVFVNPAQFGPGEDLARYPRTPEDDARGLAEHGCDALFLPQAGEIYPGGRVRTRVDVGELGTILEGASRPGHFNGVAIVVAILFNIVRPDVAVFGRKDYQQLLVIRQLVRDLAMPVAIEDVPTRREADGLAMSSRNRYLDADQRRRATAIFATLEWMAGQQRAGLPVADIERQAATRLRGAGLEPDYAVLRRMDDLGALSGMDDIDAVALVAARAGATRLIDNLATA
jgi:pantoate--beta-alanine ligase